MDNGSTHQSHKELYGTFQTGRCSHCDYSGNPLYVEIRVWVTGRALTQRTYRIFLIVFTAAGVRLEMELELAWLLPVPFLNCRTEP